MGVGKIRSVACAVMEEKGVTVNGVHVAGVTVHANLTGLLADDHAQYLLLLGRLGGQSAIGGTGAGDRLNVRGSSDADLGRVHIQSPLEVEDVRAGDPVAVRYRPTFVTGGGFVGGLVSATADVTYDNGLFIWALIADGSTYRAAAAPGFAAFTLFNALPRIQNSGDFNLVQALVLNAAPSHVRVTPGTSSTVQSVGLSFSAQARAEIAGAIMTYTTGMTAVRCGPIFSTVAGSTVNLGTTRGLHCVAPAVALFAPQAGVENLTAYYGLDFNNITFPTSGEKVVVRSAMTDAADRFFLQNNGGARSDLGGGDLLDVGVLELLGDGIGRAVVFGAGGDSAIYFDGTDLVIEPNVAPASAVVRIPGKLHVISALFPAWLVERTGSITNSVLSGFRQLGTTSGDMVDNFGTSVFWAIQDNAAVINNIGFQSCVRFGGADNTGRWRKYVYLAGVATEISRIDTLQMYVMLNGGTFRTGGGRLKATLRVAAGPYALLASDHVLLVDTDAGPVTVNLPVGIANTEYRVVNTGSSGNNVSLTPNGVELLRGVNAAFAITDGLESRVGYEATEGWW